MTEERLRRQWLLIAPRNAGKSTFAAAMSPEYLVLDLDDRWREQEKNAGGRSYRIAETDPLKIVDEMKKQWPHVGPSVNTIIVDSGTAVLDFIQSKGRLMDAAARDEKRKFNMNEVHKLKADTMRLLRLALVQCKKDYLWIFHTEERMESGQKKIRTTIPATELEAMKANLNAVMTIVTDSKGMRGVRIEWSRYNNGVAQGQIVWDTEGFWRGVPERLDVFLANFLGIEGYNGGVYSDEWLLKYLDGRGVTFKDTFEMYKTLDILETPEWFNRAAWGKIVEKALSGKNE